MLQHIVSSSSRGYASLRYASLSPFPKIYASLGWICEFGLDLAHQSPDICEFEICEFEHFPKIYASVLAKLAYNMRVWETMMTPTNEPTDPTNVPSAQPSEVPTIRFFGVIQISEWCDSDFSEI